MELRQLKYLVAIAQHGSMAAAAAQFGVVQPAIGAQIRKLEKEVGLALLNRHSRGSSLTKAGESFARDAQGILASLAEAEARLQHFSANEAETVNIGITSSVGTVIVGPLLDRLKKDLPNTRVKLFEEMPPVLAEWIADGRLSFALGYNPLEITGLRWEPVLQERLVFIQSGKHRPAETDGLDEFDFHDIADYDLALGGAVSSVRSLLERKAHEENVPLNIVYEISSLSMIKSLVMQDVTASVFPFLMIRDEVAAGQIYARTIVRPEIRRDLYLFSSKTRPLTRTEHIVKTLVQSAIRAEIKQNQSTWFNVHDRSESIEDLRRRHIRDTDT